MGTGQLSGDGSHLAISYSGTTACQGPISGSGTLVLKQRVVFVTSTTHNANFGGQVGADAYCQAAADGASGANKAPAGTYLAFLSYAASDAANVLADGRAYVLPDGTLVASSKADFLDGSIAHAIDMNQNGVGNVSDVAWTGSNADGTRNTNWNQCNDWTKVTHSQSTDVAIAGYSYKTDATWVFKDGLGSNGWWCSDSHRLYCVQQ
jgi:hypothetical protein